MIVRYEVTIKSNKVAKFIIHDAVIHSISSTGSTSTIDWISKIPFLFSEFDISTDAVTRFK